MSSETREFLDLMAYQREHPEMGEGPKDVAPVVEEVGDGSERE